jgi:hypothetical protein
MIVNYTARGDVFVAEKARLWAAPRVAEVGTARNYGLHPDGKRVAAVFSANPDGASDDSTHVTILFNFFDELKRRVK